MKLNLNRKRFILVTLFLFVSGALVVFFFWGRNANTAEFMTTKVGRGNIRNTVSATGTVQAVSTVLVGSQASGTISALFADYNSTVKKDQIIAQLDPAIVQAQVDQAQANLEQSRANYENARASVMDAQAKILSAKSTVQNLQAGVSSAGANQAMLKAQSDDALSILRQEETLTTNGVISQRELETAQTNYKTANARYDQAVAQSSQARVSEESSAGAGIAQSQAQLKQTEAQVKLAAAQIQQNEAALKLAQINLGNTTIRSPTDGVVISRDVAVGQTVAASLSAPTLFTIANDLTQMQVIANIDQADIGLVEQAKGINFTVDAFPDKEFTGTIQQIRLNAQNIQNVVTYFVVIDVSNPDLKLKPGMTSNLTFTISERNDVLKVPNAALRFTPQQTETEQKEARAQGNEGGQGFKRDAKQQQEGSGLGKGLGKPVSSTSAVIEGQTRLVWVMGQNNKPQPRRIKVGINNGAETEVVDGNLQEGETVIIGQNIVNTAKPQASQPPGLGGAQRTGRGGGRR
ncbi:MAG: efflux RND transporter periplasmic adaptor subunit [Pyrinomonadaceae bacterium]